jgi:hypothetical protein
VTGLGLAGGELEVLLPGGSRWWEPLLPLLPGVATAACDPPVAGALRRGLEPPLVAPPLLVAMLLVVAVPIASPLVAR